MAVRYNKKRHDYGIKKEELLKPLLEAFCEEPLTKTGKFYDVMDFVSDSYYVELKSRTEQYRPEDYDTWLLPCCKGTEAKKNSHKRTLFFYYFSSTKELYVLEYDEKLFATFKREVPSWHKEKQEHYYIPSSEFSLIVFE